MKKATDKEVGQDLLRGIEDQFSQALRGDDEGKTILKAINAKLMKGESFSLSFGSKISLDSQQIGSAGAKIKFSTPTELKAMDFEIDVSGQPQIENDGKTIDTSKKVVGTNDAEAYSKRQKPKKAADKKKPAPKKKAVPKVPAKKKDK